MSSPFIKIQDGIGPTVKDVKGLKKWVKDVVFVAEYKEIVVSHSSRHKGGKIAKSLFSLEKSNIRRLYTMEFFIQSCNTNRIK